MVQYVTNRPQPHFGSAIDAFSSSLPGLGCIMWGVNNCIIQDLRKFHQVTELQILDLQIKKWKYFKTSNLLSFILMAITNVALPTFGISNPSPWAMYGSKVVLAVAYAYSYYKHQNLVEEFQYANIPAVPAPVVVIAPLQQN